MHVYDVYKFHGSELYSNLMQTQCVLSVIDDTGMVF